MTVIIPTFNEVEQLPRCVAGVPSPPAPLLGRGQTTQTLEVSEALERLEGAIEIIVVDGGSTDGTVEYVVGHPRLKYLHCTRGRAPQLNVGAAAARGEYLWFLHADTVPPADWLEHLRSAARRPYPACFSLRFTGQDRSRALRLYARGSRWRCGLVRFGDQSLFVAREAFVRSGGYRGDHLLMEGHELARRLTRRCGGFTVLPAAVTTSSRRYERYGVIYTQAVFALIVGLYYLGVPQKWLKRLYAGAFPSGSR